ARQPHHGFLRALVNGEERRRHGSDLRQPGQDFEQLPEKKGGRSMERDGESIEGRRAVSEQASQERKSQVGRGAGALGRMAEEAEGIRTPIGEPAEKDVVVRDESVVERRQVSGGA